MKLKSDLLKTVATFIKDKSGSFAIMGTLLAIPLIVASGMAIDFLLWDTERKRVQTAIDGAALAVSRDMITTSPVQIRTQVVNFMRANLGADLVADLNIQVNVNTARTQVQVSAAGNRETLFLGLVGQDQVAYAPSAVVETLPQRVEVALVLDVSGSMNLPVSGPAATRLEALQSAATQFVTTVLNNPLGNQLTDIGIVPYVNFVNVGTNNRGEPWLDATTETTRTTRRRTVGSTGCQTFDVDRESGRGIEACDPREIPAVWEGCVLLRTGPTALNNGEIIDLDYRGPGQIVGPNDIVCSDSPIVPLTDDVPTLLNAIATLSPIGGTTAGNTYIPSGIAWGRRVLSSQEPFTEGDTPAQVLANRTRKIMVVMTDGVNRQVRRNFNNPRTAPRDTRNNNTPVSVPNGQTIDQCSRAKLLDNSLGEPGIEIFTIGFGDEVASSPETLQMLEDCASDIDNSFLATNTQALQDAFASIAAALLTPRLTQ